MSPLRRLAPALIALLAALVSVGSLLAPAPAGAQAGVRLEVVEQSGYVASDGTYEAALDWRGPVSGHALEVRVFQLVAEEAELEERTPSGPLNQLEPIPLASLPRDDEGRLVLRLPIRGVPLPEGDPSRLYLPDPGVYPLELQVTDVDGATVATALTDLIRLPVEVAAEPVPVSVVVGIGRDGVPLADAVALLEAHPDVEVTVLLDVAAVTGPDADPELLARLRDAIGDRHTVAVSGVPLDVSAIAEIGQLELYDRVRRSGAEQAAALLGRDVSTDVAPIEVLPTAEAASHLAGTVDALLAPVEAEDGVLVTDQGAVPVLSADEELVESLARPSRGPHHVLARLAIRYREGRTEPVLLTTQSDSGVTVDDLEPILEALARPSIITPVPLDQAGAQDATPLEPSERPRQDLRPAAELLRATLADLADYAEFYVDGPVSPQYLEDRVVSALAVDIGPEQRAERLASVRAEVGDAFDVIALPEGRTVNLAARTSHLPLTITSDAAGDRLVRISFASDKLTFPEEEGESRLAQVSTGTTSLDFVVESRSLGVSPLDVVVSTPDGSRELTRTRITIRSTAVPGLGLLLSGAALGFLVVWWVLHVVRGRREVPEVAGTEQVA